MEHPLASQIEAYASERPEGSPLSAKGLLHLGNRAAVDQALSRLARAGTLMRVGRGLYVRPVKSRFGAHAPSAARLVREIARQSGETVVSHGAAAANALGLTTQVPVNEAYLTSGRSRTLNLGAQKVQLRHVPSWQLTNPEEPAGEVVRALAWLGPEGAPAAFEQLRGRLSPPVLEKITQARASYPEWLAKTVSSALRSHA